MDPLETLRKKYRDETCAGCVLLKGNNITKYPYCEESGLNLTGTLERHDKCKKEGWKRED